MLKIRPLSPFIFSFLLSIVPQAWGSPCCGGGFAAPSLIVGDNKAQFTASYSLLVVSDLVTEDSLWYRREIHETNETFKIEAAHIFWDRWQLGFTAPIIQRTVAGERSSGLGDISYSLGYEYLTDWDYNPWRPRGHAFLQLTMPTGRPRSESTTLHQIDTRGRGFWALGLGTILTKTFGHWDFFTTVDVHRSFARTDESETSYDLIEPGFGGHFGLGSGYSLNSLRLGGALLWNYEDPVNFSGTTNSRSSAQRYGSTTLSASYLLPNQLAAMLTYFDQTLIGDPVNISLGRGASFSLQKRWPR